MKPVKNLVFAALLLCVLAFNTIAGDIQTPGVAAPQPSPTPNGMTYAGDVTTSSSDDAFAEPGETVETSDYLMFEALTALFYLY
jgi:hypothetical protein